jgi:hypothetical protein
MEEVEWLACTDPWRLLKVVKRSRPSERKVRFFNAAICRRYWDFLPEASQAILVESELLADGLGRRDSEDMDLCWRANDAVAPFDRQYPTKQFPNTEVRIRRDAAAAVCYAVVPGELFGAIGYFWEIDPAEKGVHVIIIRDVFANPFRSVVLDPTWRTPTVAALAQAAYDNRVLPVGTLEPDRLAVLADALEEAGCINANILSHLRGLGLHVRGCWPVDLLLSTDR